MAEIARTDPDYEVRLTSPPRLELVHGELSASQPSTSVKPEPNVGRSGLIGAAIGFLVAALGIGIVGTVGGMGASDAFGIGAFVGTWGGAGFGFMLGATVPYARYLDAIAPRSSHHGQGENP